MNLKETKQHITAARRILGDLPTLPFDGADLVIGQALNDADHMLKEIENLRALIVASVEPDPAPKLPTILYSLDRKLYYIDQPGRLAHHWLAVETIPGPVPDDKKDGMLDGYVQFTRGDGRVYHRRSLPFALFEVKAERESEPVDLAGDLYRDYAAFEWPNMEPPSTEMFTVVVHGTPRSVEGPSTALVSDFMAQLLAKYEPGEKIDFWELRDEAGVLLMKYQPLGRRGGQTLFLNLRAGIGA
jgi:hypothetical protein